ncbi:MAG TPA: P-loop NTPase fold protein [Pseudonocardiaceae bacterium]|nr:P-loop NTPase fold protein [Pseudonocardiaceae bacterium]
MVDGDDPVRNQVESGLYGRVLPYVIIKALEMPEIAVAIEDSGIDEDTLWDAITRDLLLTSGPEFAAVYKFARTKDGRLDQVAFNAELDRDEWPIRWGIFYDSARHRRIGQATSLHEALSEWCTVMLRDTVLPVFRRAINTELDERFSTTLSIGAIPGLERSHDVAYTVDTESTGRFRAAVARIHGSGALGLAGPRGSGKTALINQYVAGLRDTGDEFEPVGITVACPVHYEARDFVLHLHATLCRAIIERVDDLSSGERRRRSGYFRGFELRSTVGLMLIFLAVLAGSVYLLVRPDFALPILPQLLRPARQPAAWMQVLFLIGGVAAMGLFGATLRLLRQVFLTLTDVLLTILSFTGSAQLRLSQRRGASDRRLLKQQTIAELRHIKLLQTSTSGWSGTLTTPWALSAGRSKSVQLAERAQTFPEAVESLRGLIARCTETLGPVVIAIDELDKITSAERAQTFINEIKGIFGVPGCLYIVSVSDDALVTFEHSALGVRDAFDTAFDELVRIDYLSLSESLSLLHSRVIGIPEPFGWLCHCLSGGLPRELLRLLRRVADHRHHRPAPTLADLCESLVGEDLARRGREFRIMASRLTGRTPGETLKHLNRNASAKQLLATAKQLVRRPAGTPEPDTSRRRLEAATFAYYCATLKEFFTDQFDVGKASPACADGEGPGTFDQLSRARSLVPEDPRLAWFLIDDFRTTWHLEVVGQG